MTAVIHPCCIHSTDIVKISKNAIKPTTSKNVRLLLSAQKSNSSWIWWKLMIIDVVINIIINKELLLASRYHISGHTTSTLLIKFIHWIWIYLVVIIVILKILLNHLFNICHISLRYFHLWLLKLLWWGLLIRIHELLWLGITWRSAWNVILWINRWRH